MWRWLRRTLLALGALVVIAACAGAVYQWWATRRDLSATPMPGRLVDVGGHRLHVWCVGEGTPPVILESGLGGWSVDWGHVQPNVAMFTRVCSYDRAGMGYSEPGPTPRTTQQIAGELAQLLDRSGMRGPVVLVGASFGGLAARFFASANVDRVAGLVLVDASHEDQQRNSPRIAPFVPFLSSIGAFRLIDMSLGLPPASLAPSVRDFAQATKFRTAAYHAAADEMVHIRESGEEVRATRRKLTVPVIVVTAGRGSDEVWLNLQRDQVALSERGCHIIARESGHTIGIEQPHVVVDAIRMAVDEARGQGTSAVSCGARAGQ